MRGGISTKSSFNNPRMGGGDVTLDPDVVAITTRCAEWLVDPIDCRAVSSGGTDELVVTDIISKEMQRAPLHVTFREKTLGAGGKRKGWMRASATLGNPAVKKGAATPVRAVWTCSNVDADTSMTFQEMNRVSGRDIKKEVGRDTLADSYEDCLKRRYGKYVELEVLLPRTKRLMQAMRPGLAPPSLVYRVPIQTGNVNPLGMVAKSRATVTLYPRGRTLASANASGGAAPSGSTRDLAIPLGMVNFHLPLGAGLVDPGWAKGRKVFWKGRPVGVV